MTMPSKIYLDGHDPTKHFPEDTEYSGSVSYIRADLAEELARALEHYDDGRDPVVAAALAKYKEATK